MKLVRSSVFIFILLVFSSCSLRAKLSPVIYLIPENFEGAIVIFYNEKNGINPNLSEEGYILTIPNDGVLKVNADNKTLSGLPDFFLINKNGSRKKLEYHYKTNVESQFNKGRTENDVSPDAKENQVFAMNYESFNISAEDTYGKSFLVCKIKDGNLFASRDLNKKISNRK